MSPLLTELREKALRLTPNERQFLIDDLIDSLSNEPLSDIEDAWMQEVIRRDQEMIEGKVQPITHEQLFQSLNREFGW